MTEYTNLLLPDGFTTEPKYEQHTTTVWTDMDFWKSHVSRMWEGITKPRRLSVLSRKRTTGKKNETLYTAPDRPLGVRVIATITSENDQSVWTILVREPSSPTGGYCIRWPGGGVDEYTAESRWSEDKCATSELEEETGLNRAKVRDVWWNKLMMDPKQSTLLQAIVLVDVSVPDIKELRRGKDDIGEPIERILVPLRCPDGQTRSLKEWIQDGTYIHAAVVLSVLGDEEGVFFSKGSERYSD